MSDAVIMHQVKSANFGSAEKTGAADGAADGPRWSKLSWERRCDGFGRSTGDDESTETPAITARLTRYSRSRK